MNFKNISKSCLVAALFAVVSRSAEAKLNVVTTLPDLAVLTAEVAGSNANVEAIAKGTQDPHFIEAKPSYMVKLSRADLVVSVGLELEIGWLPSIIRGARNSKILTGAPGNLEVGPKIDVLEKHEGAVTRAEGDVHPDGNPHFNLDPIRMGKVAAVIAAKLGELDPSHAAEYSANALAIQKRFESKTNEWQARIQKSGVKSVVTYHKTLTYFLDRFGIANPAILEPKPGIPPTAPHIVEVEKLVKDQKIPLILIENFFETSAGDRIARDVPNVRVVAVPVSVGGEPSIKTLDDLYERLVQVVEGKK